jgi:hypothetical protein
MNFDQSFDWCKIARDQLIFPQLLLMSFFFILKKFVLFISFRNFLFAKIFLKMNIERNIKLLFLYFILFFHYSFI